MTGVNELLPRFLDTVADATAELPRVVPAEAAHQLGSSPFTVQGAVQIIGGIVALIVAVFTIVNIISARLSKIEDAQNVRIKKLEDDMTEVKITLKGFVPKETIDERFEHMRNNMRHMDESMATALRRHDDKISGMAVDLGRLGEKVDGAHNDVSEMKGMMRDLLSKFDSIRERLAGAGAGK